MRIDTSETLNAAIILVTQSAFGVKTIFQYLPHIDIQYALRAGLNSDSLSLFAFL
jgi:hypothetical protein